MAKPKTSRSHAWIVAHSRASLIGWVARIIVENQLSAILDPVIVGYLANISDGIVVPNYSGER